MINPIISTIGLTKQFGAFEAVKNLSITVDRGEIYGFLGLNGAGKTTMIRMIMGMIKPFSGSISLFSDSDFKDWHRVGCLVETPHAYPELSVRENLEVFRRLYDVADAPSVDGVIDRLALTRYKNIKARTLSSGNAQRLGLAKALLHRPELLVLDEPANGLDPAGVVEVRELLRELAREKNVTVFMSSHILDEVARLATRIGIIDQGRLLEELTADELRSKEHESLVIKARDTAKASASITSAGFSAVSDPNGRLIIDNPLAIRDSESIARNLVLNGAGLREIFVERETLEEYFLGLVGAGPKESGRK